MFPQIGSFKQFFEEIALDTLCVKSKERRIQTAFVFDQMNNVQYWNDAKMIKRKVAIIRESKYFEKTEIFAKRFNQKKNLMRSL